METTASFPRLNVDVQTVVVDRSDDQSLECPGATVVRSPGLSRGTAWAIGAEACDAPFVALSTPGVHALPNQLARAVGRAVYVGQVTGEGVPVAQGILPTPAPLGMTHRDTSLE